MSKTYIILLNHNGWQDSLECLESLMKSSNSDYQTIVIDNDSSNDSMQHILAWAKGNENTNNNTKNPNLAYLSNPEITKPNNFLLYDKNTILVESFLIKDARNSNPVIFIQSDKNNGFAAGNNIGIEYAFKQEDADYLWLLNNDTVIENNTLFMLTRKAEQYKKTTIR